MDSKEKSLKSIKLKYMEDLILSHAYGRPIDEKYVFENGLELENLIIDSKEISDLYNPKNKDPDSKKPPFRKLEEYENPTSLKDIYDLISSGFRYIKLDSDITLTDEDLEYFIDGVDIDASVIIDGCGHTIYGNQTFRIFTINHSAIIENLTFKNCGKSQRHGGAILNNGVVEIKNCRFLNGNARFGAGVSNFNILIVEDSLFKNNNARNGGGAIHNEGLVKIYSSKFEDNTCERYGGAINSERKLIINDCTFKNNKAKIQGDWLNNIGEMECRNCETDEN